MADRPSIDLTRLSTASKILLGAGLLYFIDLFLSWNRKCFEGVGCGTLSGWHGALGRVHDLGLRRTPNAPPTAPPSTPHNSAAAVPVKMFGPTVPLPLPWAV